MGPENHLAAETHTTRDYCAYLTNFNHIRMTDISNYFGKPIELDPPWSPLSVVWSVVLSPNVSSSVPC
jgi:hypothetical protein